MTDIQATSDHGIRAQRNHAGRKLHYGDQQLMEVWVFVQVGILRSGLTVEQFCRQYEFNWIQGGCIRSAEKADRKTGRAAIAHKARGATLRRRYYEAVAHLEAAQEGHRLAWEKGFRYKGMEPISPTEKWWRSFLPASEEIKQ